MRTIGVILKNKNNLNILLRHLEAESNVRIVSRDSLGEDVLDAGFINHIGNPFRCSEVFTDLEKITGKADSFYYVPHLAA